MSGPTTRATLSRRQLAGALGAAPLVAACASTGKAAEPAESAEPTLRCTLILVRHAEKESSRSRDPELSSAGVARAEVLARTFGHAGATALLHSGLKRTRDTLAPLASQLGVASEAIPPSDMPRWIERIASAEPDDVVVVAGHSNTVPALAWAFGVLLPELESVAGRPELPHGYLPHGAYDRAHVLTPGAPGSPARLLEMRYGAPS